MPEGYLTFLATGGPNAAENLVGMRVHPSAEWQGLRMIPGNQARYPLLDSYYMHGFGTGVRNRLGALIMEIGAVGQAPADVYAIPEEFSLTPGALR